MTTFVPSNLLNPQDRRLIAMVCVVQCVVVAMPALWSVYYVPLISGLLLSAGAMVFSVKRCLVVEKGEIVSTLQADELKDSKAVSRFLSI